MDPALIIGILVVFVLIGVAVWYFFFRDGGDGGDIGADTGTRGGAGADGGAGGAGNQTGLDWKFGATNPGELDFLSASDKDSCVAAYALHHLNREYKGPVARVKRLADGEKADFYAKNPKDPEQESVELLDENGKNLKDWLMEIGDGDGTRAQLDTWYDQSGKGQHTQVVTYSSPTSIEYRDDDRRRGWQITFDRSSVIRLGANKNGQSGILPNYAEFTVVLNARWTNRDWATALYVGPEQPPKVGSPESSYIYMGNHGNTGKYAFIYAGDANGPVRSSKSAAAQGALEDEPFTNLIMIGRKISDNVTEVKGYINGSGLNTEGGDVRPLQTETSGPVSPSPVNNYAQRGVIFSGRPPTDRYTATDRFYLGGHSPPQGELKAMEGKVTHIVFFKKPLAESNLARWARWGN